MAIGRKIGTLYMLKCENASYLPATRRFSILAMFVESLDDLKQKGKMISKSRRNLEF